MQKKRQFHITLTITMVIFGFLIFAQLQTQNRLATDLSSQSNTDLIVMVNNLSEKRKALASEVSTAESALFTYYMDYEDTNELLNNLLQEEQRFKIILGTTDVQGEGIKIEIDREMYLLYKDILDIVNELWAAGAQVVAINDQRLTDRSYLYYTNIQSAGTFITLNDKILKYPLTITAIGDSHTLYRSLNMPGGIISNLNLFFVYPRITEEELITIPQTTIPYTTDYSQIEKKEPALPLQNPDITISDDIVPTE